MRPAAERVRLVGGLRVGALQSHGGLAGGEAPHVVRTGPPGGGVAAAGLPGGQVRTKRPLFLLKRLNRLTVSVSLLSWTMERVFEELQASESKVKPMVRIVAKFTRLSPK